VSGSTDPGKTIAVALVTSVLTGLAVSFWVALHWYFLAVVLTAVLVVFIVMLAREG